MRDSDITLLVKEIAGQTLVLDTLRLCENKCIDDKLAKEISLIFESCASLKHLYLNETSITIKGLKTILKSIHANRNVRTISVEKCGLSLLGKQGDIVINLLKDNISLTALEVTKNVTSLEFMEKLFEEIELNMLIVKHIFP